jgi:hypothetical protein
MKFKLIVLLLSIFIFWINTSFSAINLTVSPIKYELEWNPWDIITKTATLNNKWNSDIIITTWKSDFIASWEDWSVKFVRYSELVHSDQQLSDWITLSSTGFIISPGENKIIDFEIKIPENTTPWGHYWAIFFKNNNSENSSNNWNSVWINVDYWILILLKVNWKIITDVEIETNNIKVITSNSSSSSKKSKWWYSSSSKKIYNLVNSDIVVKKDSCLIDFTNSSFDWKCFNNLEELFELTFKGNKIDIINEGKNTDYIKEDFSISFTIPVNNKWNTHIKATWEIELFDEDWNQIKQIWKKIIINDKWAIIWEEIVDFIPINDNNWNVLPWTKRIFNPEWQGFPYKERDEKWNQIIKYKNPWEHYSEESNKWNFRLMPWERISYDKETKKIKAKFDVNYIDEEWENISFPSAQEFEVTYIRKYIWINYYLILPIILIILIFSLLWFISLLKRRKCINKKCWKKIKKYLKKCPYCLEKQNKKRKKKV